MGSVAHVKLVLRAALQTARALVQVDAKGIAHLDVKVAAQPAHLLEHTRLHSVCHTNGHEEHPGWHVAGCACCREDSHAQSQWQGLAASAFFRRVLTLLSVT